MTAPLGELYVHALASKNADALKSLFSPNLDFKALTPGQFWESNDADEVVDATLLGEWFEPQDRITDIIGIESDRVGARERISYRLALSCPDGDYVVEQQAYYETDGARITWLRILCSGFQPLNGG